MMSTLLTILFTGAIAAIALHHILDILCKWNEDAVFQGQLNALLAEVGIDFMAMPKTREVLVDGHEWVKVWGTMHDRKALRGTVLAFENRCYDKDGESVEAWVYHEDAHVIKAKWYDMKYHVDEAAQWDFARRIGKTYVEFIPEPKPVYRDPFP